MLYKRLGKNGPEVSVLSFGCMRFPGREQELGHADFLSLPPDEEKSLRLIHLAIDQGINYFDTAYPYHGGKSEKVLGKAVRGCRENLLLATKLPTWMVEKAEDFERLLTEQLRRLETDYLDFYLLHGLNTESWSKMKGLDIFSFLERVMADGRVRRVGFSFHDELPLFKEIVDAYDWTMCQIQYNFFDSDYQAGRAGLEYASARGIGVVVMEPLRGGTLVDPVPEEVQALWDSAPANRSAAEWALHWLFSQPEVTTVLSSMRTEEQLLQNVKSANVPRPKSLSTEELALIDGVKRIYRRLLKVDCTRCAYCMPCPQGVNIPENFTRYNDYYLFNDKEISVLFYNQIFSPESRAANCIQCGECEPLCPQHIRIGEELKNVHAALYRSVPSPQ